MTVRIFSHFQGPLQDYSNKKTICRSCIVVTFCYILNKNKKNLQHKNKPGFMAITWLSRNCWVLDATPDFIRSSQVNLTHIPCRIFYSCSVVKIALSSFLSKFWQETLHNMITPYVVLSELLQVRKIHCECSPSYARSPLKEFALWTNLSLHSWEGQYQHKIYIVWMHTHTHTHTHI